MSGAVATQDAGDELDVKYKTGAGVVPAEVRYGGAMVALMFIKGRYQRLMLKMAELRAGKQTAGPMGTPPPEQKPDPGLNLAENQPDPNRH